MNGHVRQSSTRAGVEWDAPVVGHCECGWSAKVPLRNSDAVLEHAHRDHLLDMAAELAEFHCDFYRRTDHCGLCGQPGTYCLCTAAAPCGCASLHPMGSGLDRDVAQFADAGGIDQDGLFG